MKIKHKSLGETIKSLRTKKGWTQNEFVERLGANVTDGYISRIEINNEIPSPDMLRRISDTLEINFALLISIAKRDKIKKTEKIFDKRYKHTSVGGK